MHILIIHQAFASLDEPGGTRHHEFARLLSAHGHRGDSDRQPGELYNGRPPSPLHSPHLRSKWGEPEGARVTAKSQS